MDRDLNASRNILLKNPVGTMETTPVKIEPLLLKEQAQSLK